MIDLITYLFIILWELFSNSNSSNCSCFSMNIMYYYKTQVIWSVVTKQNQTKPRFPSD